MELQHAGLLSCTAVTPCVASVCSLHSTCGTVGVPVVLVGVAIFAIASLLVGVAIFAIASLLVGVAITIRPTKEVV